MRVTLAIAELANRRQRFRGFQVIVPYRPDPSGLRATLVRDGIIQLGGRRFRIRTQVVLRGVFAKIFPRREPVHLLRQRLVADPRLVGLQINQFVAEDGWIGLAVGPEPSPSSDPQGA
jgi:hypothetical protein